MRETRTVRDERAHNAGTPLHYMRSTAKHIRKTYLQQCPAAAHALAVAYTRTTQLRRKRA